MASPEAQPEPTPAPPKVTKPPGFWTPEMVSKAIDEMTDAGITEGEQDEFFRDQGVLPKSEIEKAGTPQGAVESLMRYGLPVVGGAVGAGALSRLGLLAQGAGEWAGIAGGDMAGRKFTGEPQDVRQSLALGGLGAMTGMIGRLGTRGIGSMGGIPRYATMEAGVPTAGLPSYQKVGLTPGSSPGPQSLRQLETGASPRLALTDRIRGVVGQLREMVTPEREAKVALLKQADATGARVRVEPIVDAIAKHQVSDAFMPDAQQFNDVTNKIFDDLADVANKNGGTLKPSQLDEIIRTQLRPKAWSATTGGPVGGRVGAALRDAHEAATAELNRVLPPDVAEKNRIISEKLNVIDDADRLFGPDAGGAYNRISNIVGNDENRRTLSQAMDLAGKPGRGMTRKAIQQGAREEMTTSITRRSPSEGRPGKTGVEVLSRGATKLLAPTQPYMGGIAAAGYKKAGIDKDVADRLHQALDAAMQAIYNP